MAKPLVKATGEAGSKEKEGGGAEEEEDEGEATPDGNKRLLADILSVSSRPVNVWGLGVCLTWLGLARSCVSLPCVGVARLWLV